MAKIEVGLVVLTALIFAVVPKPPETAVGMAIFIPICIVFWSVFGAWRVRNDPALLDRWGLRPTAHLAALLRILVPLLLLLMAGGVVFAFSQGRDLVPAYLWLSFLMYPLWGLIQQWLVQALLVGNIKELSGAPLPALMALGAIGFGAIHFAHPLLVVATGCLGAVYVFLFQRHPNLFPLAVCHGWLGSLFYPYVLELNPTAAMMAVVMG